MPKFTVAELLEAHDELERRVGLIADAYKELENTDERHGWYLSEWEHHEEGIYLRFERCYSCDSDYSHLEAPPEWLDLDADAVFTHVKNRLAENEAEAKRIRETEEKMKEEKLEAAERRAYERLKAKYEG